MCTVRSQVLSLNTDDYTPTHLWLLDSAHHGVSSNSHTLYASLHDVSLTPGPWQPSQNGSLEFQGTPSSYVDIPNSGGLNATSVFAWVMVLKPTSVTGEHVILEYWDGTGGVRLKQLGDELVVEAHDMGNTLHTLTTNQNVLTANTWKFVTLTFMGFNKKKLQLIYDAYDVSGKPNNKVSMNLQAVLRGTGDVRLGASRDTSLSAFSGHVACLRYYNAYIGKYQTGYALSCDPASGIFPTATLDSLSGKYRGFHSNCSGTQSRQMIL